MLSHDVYFTLRDPSPRVAAKLVAACHEYLAPIAGVVTLVAGARNEGLERDVNDRDFHVALHVVFADREAHDAYQAAPAHDAFIAENEADWAAVRVFDSLTGAG